MLSVVAVMTWLTQKQVAELWGIHPRTLSKAIPYLNGFPASKSEKTGRGGRKQYDTRAVLAWAKKRNLVDEIRQALARHRSCTDADETTTQRLHLSRRFLAGDFDPKAKRQRHELRKLTSRITQPKTHRVTLVHDWMTD